MKHLLTIATFLSAIGFCFLVIMWPVSYHLNLSRSIGSSKLTPSDYIPITPHYHLGFEGGSMWLYTYEMPYRGGIISLSDTNDPPPIVRAWHLGDYGFAHVIDLGKGDHISERSCDLPGVYFRWIWRFDENPPYTTLCLSLWYPILLLAVLPMLWILRRGRLWFRNS